jgi:hypothetical protein
MTGKSHWKRFVSWVEIPLAVDRSAWRSAGFAVSDDLILGEVVIIGIIQRMRLCGGGFASEHGKAARGGFGVEIMLICLRHHQDVVNAVILPENVWGDVGIFDRVNDPAVGKPKDNANDERGG